MARFWSAALVALLLLLIPGSLKAEEDDAAKETQKAEQWKISAELRWRGEFRDNTDFQPADDFDAFLGQRIRLRLLLRAHKRLSFFVEGQDVWLFGAERDKVIHNLATNLYQAYADWSLAASSPWQCRRPNPWRRYPGGPHSRERTLMRDPFLCGTRCRTTAVAHPRERARRSASGSRT